MNKLTISVIIPAFNEERYLSQCLASLKKQTYSPLEIIVVNNNSTDKTAQIAKDFGAKVVREKKQGIAYARDAGFKAAQGEIVARTDADTILPPNWLLKIAKNFQKNFKAIAVGGTNLFYDLPPFLNHFSEFWFNFWLYFSRIVVGHYIFIGTNYAIKRKVLIKISPCSSNPYFYEDMDLSCHVAAYGKMIFDPSLKVYTSSRRLKKNPLTLIHCALLGSYTILSHKYPFVRSNRKK